MKFKEYVASMGAMGVTDGAELDELIARYEWFTAARVVRAVESGIPDARLGLVADRRAVTPLSLPQVDVGALTRLSAEDLIDRFLQEDSLRIVAEEGEPENEVCTTADLDDEDDLVSEELAEIYLAQGLNDRAIAIYRKLSLRNPEKSVYFAELIGRIELK